MSHATKEYAGLISALTRGNYKVFRGFIESIDTPLKDSIPILTQRINFLSEGRAMQYVAALLLYEEGFKQWHYKNLVDKIYQARLTDESIFDISSHFWKVFERMLEEKLFIEIKNNWPQNHVKDKYMLNEEAQKFMDALLEKMKAEKIQKISL